MTEGDLWQDFLENTAIIEIHLLGILHALVESTGLTLTKVHLLELVTELLLVLFLNVGVLENCAGR